MRCARSKVDCRRCPRGEGAECEIRVERDVLMRELRRIRKHMDDTLIIINAVLRK
ncbi:MAG: hypothetical protein OEZ48_01525 [Candidatus Bathyarchaeota archaeon]|nr:hypothetical protein [Candidatus Bathyarchaeota archaeon]